MTHCREAQIQAAMVSANEPSGAHATRLVLLSYHGTEHSFAVTRQSQHAPLGKQQVKSLKGGSNRWLSF
jgi:hypothetical protein